MTQKKSWEREYESRKLMTMGEEPQADVLRFLKWLKKSQDFTVIDSQIIDLGCGTGRNANYLAGLGAKVFGLEIAHNAISEAVRRAKKLVVSVEYYEQSIGEHWPVEDCSADLLIDVTSSNSLNEEERQYYLSEASRVLKDAGLMFVRALCKEGDKNAKQLLKDFPGKEKDTYVLKGVGITERVFSKSDFRSLYEEVFDILKFEKKTGYQRFNNQSYKRNYWLAYLKKK